MVEDANVVLNVVAILFAAYLAHLARQSGKR